MEALAPALAGANSRPVIGVLGVTPELVQLPWQGTVDLRAFDQSAEMIARVWTPNPNIASEVQVARWQELPAADQSLDAVIGDGSLYVLESLDEYVSVLTQVHRVLRPGGRFVCLEFSRPHFWLRPFYDLYSYFVIPRLGAWVARQPIAYQYLVDSIRRFPDQASFAAALQVAGFADVAWRNLSFGIACLHFGTKPHEA